MALNAAPSGAPLLRKAALERWLNSPRGQKLLALESQEIDRVLPEVLGRHAVQIGDWGHEGLLLRAAQTLHRATLGMQGGPQVSALARPELLPFREKCIDAVLLPHTLEFTRSPHDVLREATRILTDRGRLFVLGFNPWSTWIARGWFGLRHPAFPAMARPLSASRLHEWLAVLDYEMLELRRFGAGFPWLSARSLGERWSPGHLLAPFAEAYLLVARRRVLPMNFIARVQRAQVKPLVGVPVPGARAQANFKEK